MNVRSLPDASIVAAGPRVWVKRSNEERQPKGSPFHEMWWIEADTDGAA